MASPGSTIDFPTLALSSSSGTCAYLTSAGALNFALTSVAGLGQVVAGPLTGNAGPVPVHLLAGVANTSIPNPALSLALPIHLTFQLQPLLGGTVEVPVGESLVLWIQDDPAQFGPGTMQYWIGSHDERNGDERPPGAGRA